MEENELLKKINELTEGYKGGDDPIKKIDWLADLIDSYKRYLPSRVVEKIKLDPAAKKIEGERRNITVAFADLSGFTALSESMDPEDIAHIINDFFTRMLQVVFKYGGSVDKFLGDALMVLFGAPIAHHDDPERAVRAALEMQKEMLRFNEENKFEQPLSMSIGINTGPAVALNVGSQQRMEYTVIGDTVNLSARLEKVAQAGEIIISQNTYQNISDVVDAEKRRAVKVKGKRRPIQIYLVKEVRERYKLPNITRLELIGRNEELQTIKNCIDEVKQNYGKIIGLVGDPGVGKTRLAVEGLVIGQQNDFITLNTRCMPYETNTPYTTFIGILNDYFEIKKDTKEEEKKLLISLKLKNLELGLNNSLPFVSILYGIIFPEVQELPPDKLKHEIFQVIRKIIYGEAKKTPLMIRVEDLQWCDPTSFELFDYLLGGIEEIPLLLLYEYRSDYAFPWLGLKNCTNIVLKNFSIEETKKYIKTVLNVQDLDREILDVIYEKSIGNPLFVQEIVKFLLKKGGIRRVKGKAVKTNRFKDLEIAESISGVILAQIDRMSEADRHTLQYASVMGKIFKPDLLSKIINVPEGDLQADLERLEHFEGVLTSYPAVDKKAYEFLSPTTYEVIYGSLFKTRRKEIHAQIGQTLEQLFSDRLFEYFEQLAYHFARSTDEGKGIKYLKSAAEKSYHLYAIKESVTFFKEALNLLSKKNLSLQELKDKLEILRRQGFLFSEITGDFSEALKNQKKSLKLARRLQLPQDEAMACNNIGIIYQKLGFPKKGLSYWTRARRIAKKIDDKNTQVLAVNNLGNYYLHTGNLKKAFEYFNEVAILSKEINNKKGIALANLNLGSVVERMGNFSEALEYYNNAYKYFEEIGEKENITRCLNMIGIANLSIGNLDEAMKKLNEAVTLASDIGDKITETNALGNIGLVFAQMWQLDKAYERFSQALTIAQMIGEPHVIMAMNMNIGDIHLYQGNIKHALDYHNKGVELALQIQDPFNEAIVRKSIGWDYFYQGDYKKAKQEFEKSQRLFQNIGDRRNKIIALIGFATVITNLGLYEQTSQIISSIETKAREMNDLEILGFALDIKADILLNKREYKNAKEILEEVLDLSQKTGNKRLYAWALGKMALVLLNNNRLNETKEHIENSLAFAQEINDKLLDTYNLITNAKLSTTASDFTNSLNTLMKVTEQARHCGAKEYLAQGLSLAAQIFKKIGKHKEHQNYLAEYNKVITSITDNFTEEEKETYLKRIEASL